jgi:5-methylcytosine-specific restriction endonuclease McrA
MWKGGVSSERERIASTKKYKDWKQAIFERDAFVCAKCGDSESKLNTHHIEDFRSNTTKRIDPNNGITLCQSCHLAFHRKYGRQNTTNEQLMEFLLQ